MKETTIQRSRRQAFERKLFVSVLRAAGNHVFEEHRFDAKRRWRFDIALYNPDPLTLGFRFEKVAIEIEGLGGRHQTIGGFTKDLEKYAEAFAQGWNVLRVSWEMIGSGKALSVLAKAGVRVNRKEGGSPWL